MTDRKIQPIGLRARLAIVAPIHRYKATAGRSGIRNWRSPRLFT
jgi:hypothetical protein